MKPPWTEIGALQRDIDEIRQNLRNKAEDYDIRQTNCTLDRLEHSVREISATLDGLRTRIEALEDQIRTQLES